MMYGVRRTWSVVKPQGFETTQLLLEIVGSAFQRYQHPGMGSGVLSCTHQRRQRLSVNGPNVLVAPLNRGCVRFGEKVKQKS